MRIRSFSRFMRQPPGPSWSTRLARAVIVAGTIVVIAAVARNLWRHDSITYWRQTLETAAGTPAWPEWSPTWPSLPPQAQRRHQIPQDLHGAYAYAARNAQLLRHIPCYCGCVREGHRSNLNCFVSEFAPDGTPIWTDHSYSCPMCVHIAREVMLMTSQGVSLRRTRDEIEKHYRTLGEPTNTPIPGDARLHEK